MKKDSFRITDLFRIIIVLFIIGCLMIPTYLKKKEEKYWREWNAQVEKWEEERARERAEWEAMTDEEKFIWFVKDLDKDANTIKDIAIDEQQNAIFIYVSGLPKQNMPEDSWEAYEDYIRKMANIALETDVTKEIYLVGRTRENRIVWTVDKYGTITEF